MADDLNAMPTELHWLTIGDAARLIERHRLSPVELTDALLARIEALDPQLNAFLLLTPGKAREQAKAAEREIMAGSYRGPLHGIPFGLKDIYATAGIRTTSHSKICENLIPTEDATTVSKFYQAGGVLLGKLATHEFAHGGPSFDLAWPPDAPRPGEGIEDDREGGRQRDHEDLRTVADAEPKDSEREERER